MEDIRVMQSEKDLTPPHTHTHIAGLKMEEDAASQGMQAASRD